MNLENNIYFIHNALNHLLLKPNDHFTQFILNHYFNLLGSLSIPDLCRYKQLFMNNSKSWSGSLFVEVIMFIDHIIFMDQANAS